MTENTKTKKKNNKGNNKGNDKTTNDCNDCK